MHHRNIAVVLLAALYHESGRPSVAAGDFTEFPQLSEEARRGRELTADVLLGRFDFDSRLQRDGAYVAATDDEVEGLAQAIHDSERAAVDRGWVVVKLNPPRAWIPFAEMPAPAQEGRRSQARYLLERFVVRPRRNATEAVEAERRNVETVPSPD